MADEPGAQQLSRDELAIIGEEKLTRKPYTRTTFGIPLYTYEEVPNFLKGNPHVVCGYRSKLPFDLCVKSLFIWSNESMNIWTHLLGFIYFLYLIYEDNAVFLPNHGSDIGDHITFIFFDFCCMVCMFCSAGYHLFNCLSEHASKLWLRLDLGGISVGLCGCYFPGAYYAFFCHQNWQFVYMVLMFCLAISGMVVQLHPQFLTAKWHLRRLFLYAALIFAGIIPIMHWIITNGGIKTPLVKIFVPKLAIMYLFAIFGGLFYLTKFPENKCPGRVDFVGSSHQWWHLMVLLGYVWTHYCTKVIFLYWKENSCTEHFANHPPPLGITNTV